MKTTKPLFETRGENPPRLIGYLQVDMVWFNDEWQFGREVLLTSRFTISQPSKNLHQLDAVMKNQSHAQRVKAATKVRKELKDVPPPKESEGDKDTQNVGVGAA